MVRSVCIVLPTYNEAGNIVRTLDRIYTAVKGSDVNFLTLVVDDNSPDGTAAIALAYGEKNPNVHVLQRQGKEGLGAAYIAGMRYALRKFDPEVIMEMDADGSHNANDIPRLINAIDEGADVAIGSRYVAGGSIPEKWGFYRKLNSTVANTLVRSVLSIGGVKDCTGGFRAIRTTFLELIDLDGLQTKGYAFQISLLSALSSGGAYIVEVPIHFSDREIGTSKMRLKDQIEFIITTFRLRAVSPTVRARRVAARPSGQKVMRKL
jgi:dolichol-phosphate mannosyltransferase